MSYAEDVEMMAYDMGYTGDPNNPGIDVGDEAKPPCPICNDRFIVIVAGPDDNGQFDADDCPCQVLDEVTLADLIEELADASERL